MYIGNVVCQSFEKISEREGQILPALIRKPVYLYCRHSFAYTAFTIIL